MLLNRIFYKQSQIRPLYVIMNTEEKAGVTRFEIGFHRSLDIPCIHIRFNSLLRHL
jgi:hypothetical protein